MFSCVPGKRKDTGHLPLRGVDYVVKSIDVDVVDAVAMDTAGQNCCHINILTYKCSNTVRYLSPHFVIPQEKNTIPF